MIMLRKEPRRHGGTKFHRGSLCTSVSEFILTKEGCLCGAKKIFTAFALLIPFALLAQPRHTLNFNKEWKFFPGDDSTAYQINYDDGKWRTLNLPHDWSIEGEFGEKHPTTFNQGALPAGIGWYRKTFTLPDSFKAKLVSINFEGVYRNGEVWINGHYLGKRPNGYISFRYEISSYLKFGKEKNFLVVKVDNSLQPSSRWYTGSGIYRNVWLEATNKIAIDRPETFITTTRLETKEAVVAVFYKVKNAVVYKKPVLLSATFYNAEGKRVATGREDMNVRRNLSPLGKGISTLTINNPKLWSVGSPYLYKLILTLSVDGNVVDRFETAFGIRSISFDSEKGFFLNNQPLKIKGVCLHHDLGALGAAFNKRAAERQLQILKDMGCNAIRTAHNPPAPEFLDLCDKMGFLVMDEAFDMWKKRKNKFDYSVDFDQWHEQDLGDMVKRDRNHPSVFMWSIGNEIREQFDTSGTRLAKELASIVKRLDPTRPVTSALTETFPEKNFIWQSGALDVLGFNYKLYDYAELPKRFPGQKFIASETASALATRGHYDMPSDTPRLWPPDAKSTKHGNPDYTVSAYDNVYAYWGASHEASWKAVKKYPFMAGTFVWSGFDFIGEPVPYSWPAKSSYYGIVDLAGFPKDVYYLYQSEWTTEPVLHIFPHWNWPAGDSVDVWAYYNNADEVELFVNDRSLGVKSKEGDSLHVQWRVKYEPGTVRAVSRKNGKTVLRKEIKTAGKPAKISLVADRKVLSVNGEDLSFVTVKVTDADGNIVPYADNLLRFSVTGPAVVAGVDNGNPVSHEPFKASQRKAFNGLCLAIVQTAGKRGDILLKATAEGLSPSSVRIKVN